jgi:glycosyltransferase involved in cell wall biosynthesis
LRAMAPSRFPDLTVIVPTLNEEEGLPIVLFGLRDSGVDDILVVDGGSTDRTVEIAKESGARVLMQEGKGKGNAFRTFLGKYPIKDGWKYVMLDGDASYDPREVGKLYKALQSSPVASGARSTVIFDPKSLIHTIGGSLISWLGSLLFLRWNPDICTGYWGFRGEALKKLRIDAQGFELEANIFTQAAKRGFGVAVVPVSYAKRAGEAKLTTLDAFKILLKLLKDRLSP